MSHIRDAMPHGSKHCACPRQLQGPFLTEQLPQELQCQFVLKPSQVAPCQQLNGTLSPQPISLCPRSLATWPCYRRRVCRAGAQREARRSAQVYLPAARGGCSVALTDLSVLLYMCHLCKSHFDKLPVK